MTYREMYLSGKRILSEHGAESAAFDMGCIMEKLLGISPVELRINGSEELSEDQEKVCFRAVEERCSGRPLQYIIGEWDFMGRTFEIGEGVLIPRDDTEVSIYSAEEEVKPPYDKRLLDLCSGSGIIAITLAGMFPDSEITAIELSDDAFLYLEKNIKRYGMENIRPFKGDAFVCFDDFTDGYFDAIVSNPPYIRSDDIYYLQSEVRHEPVMALDGGEDGLDFYRLIAEKWSVKLKSGGKIILEIGEEQAAAVSELLEKGGFSNIKVIKDIQELDRVIIGTKK